MKPSRDITRLVEIMAALRDPDIGHLAPALVRTDVGLEGIVRPVRRADERPSALEDRIERLLVQHLLPVERRDEEPSGHRVRPPGRNRAVGVTCRCAGGPGVPAADSSTAKPAGDVARRDPIA